MKRAVVFDLDGTLWDAVTPLTDYWNEVRQQELPGCRRITAAQMQSWMGQGVRELARSILPERPLDAWFDAYLQYLHGENAYLLHHPPTLYPQLHQTFDALRAQGLSLMICSNCGLGYIETFLQHTGLGPAVCDTENPGRTGLTKAENIQLLLRRNGIDRALYLGDTAGDQAAAAGAGIPFVHAAYGFGAVPDATLRIPALSALPALTARCLPALPSM